MKTIKTIIFMIVYLSSFSYSLTYDGANLTPSGAGCGPVDFSKYACTKRDLTDTGVDEVERTIVATDFPNSRIFCNYGKKGNDGDPVRMEPLPCDIYNNVAVNINKSSGTVSIIGGDSTASLGGYLAKFNTIISVKGAGIEMTAWNALPSSSSLAQQLSSLYALAKQYQGPVNNKNTPWAGKMKTIIKSSNIDSSSKYEETMSAQLTAVFTADPNYFINKFINPAGELELKAKYKTLTSTLSATDASLWQTIVSIFTGPDNSGMGITYTPTTSIDFLDKQVLGFFIKMMELLRDVYTEMMFMFFVIAAGYTVGFYAYKKKMEKFGKEPFNINKMAFTATASLAFLFFSAPMLGDGEINEDDPSQANTVHVVKKYSTLAQETLRYTAQTSNYFANMASDAVMKAYLEMVSKKQGFIDINRNDIDMLALRIEKIETNKRKLNTNLGFYFEKCRKYFKLESKQMFDSENGLSKENVTTDEDSVLSDIADRLNFGVCSEIEGEVVDQVNDIALSSVSLKKSISTLTNLINGDGESFKRIGNFVKLNAWGQTNFGWVFVSVIPVSYYFFENSGIFAYDAITNSDEKTLIAKTNAEKKVNDVEKGNDTSTYENVTNAAEKAAEAAVDTSFVSHLYMFVLPGFGKIYGFINDLLHGYGFGGKDNSIKTRTTSKNKVMKLINFLKGAGKLGFVAGGIFSIALSVLSLYLAAALYEFIISTVTVIFVSALIVIKITLYYIELMVFFLVIPIKGIFFVIMSSGQGKNYLGIYMQSLIGLFITPILIVLAAGVLIPAYEFFKSFFSMLIGLITSVLDNGTAMVKAAGNDKGDAWDMTVAINKIMMVSGLTSLASIFSYFAMIIIAFIILMNIKSWFLKMTGLEGALDLMKETGSELKHGTAGRVINPMG